MNVTNVKRRIAIFCRDDEFRDKIFNELTKGCDVETRKTSFEYRITYGGIEIYILKAYESARGCRFHEVFLQKGIDIDFAKCVAMPLMNMPHSSAKAHMIDCVSDIVGPAINAERYYQADAVCRQMGQQDSN